MFNLFKSFESRLASAAHKLSNSGYSSVESWIKQLDYDPIETKSAFSSNVNGAICYFALKHVHKLAQTGHPQDQFLALRSPIMADDPVLNQVSIEILKATVSSIGDPSMRDGALRALSKLAVK